MFSPLFWREFFELLLPGEQLIAVFQSGKRRRALPLIGWQGVERLVELPPGVSPARRRKVRSASFPPAAKTTPAPLLLLSNRDPLRWARGWIPGSL